MQIDLRIARAAIAGCMIAAFSNYDEAEAAQVCFTTFTPGNFSVREVQRIDEGDGPFSSCPSATNTFTGTLPGSGLIPADDTPFFTNIIIGANGVSGDPATLTFSQDVGLGQRSASQLTVTNRGIFELSNDSNIFDLGVVGSADIGVGIAPKFINEGLFIKTGGSGTSVVSVQFDNEGGMIIEGSGKIDITHPLSNLGIGPISGSGSLSLSAGLDIRSTVTSLGNFIISDGHTVSVRAGGSISQTTLRTEGTGEIVLADLAKLNNVTNEGRVRIVTNGSSGNSAVEFSGTITNNGEIISGPSIGGTQLEVLKINEAGVILDGNGVFRVGEDATKILRFGGGILTNSGNTITGAGKLLSGDSSLGSGEILNQALIEAANGETFTIDGTKISNSSTGIIQARDGSTLRLEGGGGGDRDGSIVGGTVRTEGTGEIVLADLAKLNNVTNEGRVRIVTNASLSNVEFLGTITNNGEIISGPSIGGTEVDRLKINEAGVILDGNGVFRVGEDATKVLVFGGGTLTNSGNTITGAGRLVHSSSLGDGEIINQGFIEADAGKTFNIDGIKISNDSTGVIETKSNGHLIISERHDNNGIINIESDSDIVINTIKEFNTSGSLGIDVLGAFLMTATGTTIFNQSSGATTVNGLLSADEININGGSIGGSGEIVGNLNIGIGGSINPGNSPGTLVIDGDFTLDFGSSLFLEVDGILSDEFDRILVSGDLNLAGNIIFQLATGITNDLFENIFSIDDFILDFNPSTDEATAFVDLALFSGANYFLQSGSNTFDVTFNQNDGTFSVASEPTSSTNVPEPGALILFGIGLLGLGVIYRRKKAA